MIEPVLSDDAFLADVVNARREEGLHLWWLGQSGFLVMLQGRCILLDPYLSDSLTTKYAETDKPHVRMTRRVIDPARLNFVDVVTSSHAHTDHLDAETLRPILHANRGGRICLLVPSAIRKLAADRLGIDETWSVSQPGDGELTSNLNGFQFTGVPAAHARLDRDANGFYAYLGYVIRMGRFTIYHSGDTVVYDGMVERLRPFNLDLAILPINGKVGNMSGRDAARLAHDIGAKLVVPCHYDMFEFNTADPHDEFVPECERLGQPYKVLRAGERLTLAGGAAEAAPGGA